MIIPHQKMNRYCMASAAIFLAAKLDEDESRDEGGLLAPRIVAAANKRMKYSPKMEKFKRQVQTLLDNESILLQALGFDLEDILHRNRIVHDYKNRVEAIKQSSKAAIYKDLDILETQTLYQRAWHVATFTLLQTNLWLSTKQSVVADISIHLAHRWSGQPMPNIASTPALEAIRDWNDFLQKCPPRMRKKILASEREMNNEKWELLEKLAREKKEDLKLLRGALKGLDSEDIHYMKLVYRKERNRMVLKESGQDMNLLDRIPWIANIPSKRKAEEHSPVARKKAFHG